MPTRDDAAGAGPRMAVSLAAGLVFILLLSAPAAARPRDPRLAHVHTFAFAIGSGMLSGDLAVKFAGYDLVIVDGEYVRATQVAALHSIGCLVLGYLSVGTIEDYRWWYPLVKRYRLEYWDDWGEWYADTSRSGYRSVVTAKVAPPMLDKGLDGLFLDNVDMIADHRPQRAGMYTLVRALAALVHARGGLLFAQNGDTVVTPVLAALDGWNREDVSWTYDFDLRRYMRVPAADRLVAANALRRIAAAGLLVTATDYTRSGDIAARNESVVNACAAGAVPFVSNIGLSRLPIPPLSCR